jgi:rod shape-determining protein MreB
MDEALIRYMKNQYNLSIGEKTAEHIKITHGTVNGRYNNFEIRGMDCVDHLPRALTLSASIFKKAFGPVITAITNAILETLEQLPPELAGDIVDKGIVFAGGGSMLNGLDGYLREKLNIPVSRPENALFCVAEGTRKILEDFDEFKPILLN